MIRISYAVAAAVSVAVCTQASAQLTLALDINGFEYGFFDSSGAAGFGGADHTGTMRWSFTSEEPRIVEARIGQDGPFGLLDPVAIGAGLASLEGTIDLTDGRIDGGSFVITLDSGGDTYRAEFGSGGLTRLTSGGYILDGLTFAGVFSDDMFGDIDVSEFNQVGDLPGLAIVLRMDPTRSGDGSGTADLEVFVMVPIPPAAAAGLVTLSGVIGFSCLRRRRQGMIA